MTDALVGTTWVPPGLDPSGPWALAGGRWHWGTPEVSDDPAVLDGTGTWVVCLPAQGPMVGGKVSAQRLRSLPLRPMLLLSPQPTRRWPG